MDRTTLQQKEIAENAKLNGYYVLVSIDERKKQKMYSLVKDIDSTTKSIKFEMNRASYLLCKNIFCFEIKKEQTTFLNFVPFAELNKTKEPLQQVYTDILC